MVGYRDDQTATDEVMRGGYYHTGDVASRDEDGYITYVGRSDDVFKASDYRISPFELESVLIEHPAVAEAAVVPAPGPGPAGGPQGVRRAGRRPCPRRRRPPQSILRYVREHLAPYKRVRRLEFGELPKTISGKIRRVELRTAEHERDGRAEQRVPRGGLPRPQGRDHASDLRLYAVGGSENGMEFDAFSRRVRGQSRTFNAPFARSSGLVLRVRDVPDEGYVTGPRSLGSTSRRLGNRAHDGPVAAGRPAHRQERQRRAVARHLRAQGATYREIARLIGVAPVGMGNRRALRFQPGGADSAASATSRQLVVVRPVVVEPVPVDATAGLAGRPTRIPRLPDVACQPDGVHYDGGGVDTAWSLKLDRAGEHLAQLRGLVAAYLASDAYRLVPERDEHESRLRLHIDRQPPPQWSPIIGFDQTPLDIRTSGVSQ